VSPSWIQILIVLVILLLLFGRRLPEVARNLGASISHFKRGMDDVKGQIEKGGEETDSAPAALPSPAAETGSEAKEAAAEVVKDVKDEDEEKKA